MATNPNQMGYLKRIADGIEGKGFVAVAAGQTDEPLGVAGDFLSHIVIQPAALTIGTVVVEDDDVVVYTLTAGDLLDLRPITVPLNIDALGDLIVTTGASVAVTAFGSLNPPAAP